MSPDDRVQWIVEWLRKRPGQSVSILDAEFVGAYIDATKAPFKPQMFGAEKCAQLGRDLGRMHTDYWLKRVAVGLPPGDAAMGFPKWVYHYSLDRPSAS